MFLGFKTPKTIPALFLTFPFLNFEFIQVPRLGIIFIYIYIYMSLKSWRMPEKDTRILETRDIYNSEGIPSQKQRGSQRTCLYNGPRLFRLFSPTQTPKKGPAFIDSAFFAALSAVYAKK